MLSFFHSLNATVGEHNSINPSFSVTPMWKRTLLIASKIVSDFICYRWRGQKKFDTIFFPLVFITISWQSYSLGAFYPRKWHTIDSAIESKWNRKIIYLKCNDRNGIMKTVIDSFHSHCTSMRTLTTKLKYWSDAENWNLERLDNDAE